MQRLLQLKHPHHATQITLSRAQVIMSVGFIYSQEELDRTWQRNFVVMLWLLLSFCFIFAKIMWNCRRKFSMKFCFLFTPPLHHAIPYCPVGYHTIYATFVCCMLWKLDWSVGLVCHYVSVQHYKLCIFRVRQVKIFVCFSCTGVSSWSHLHGNRLLQGTWRVGLIWLLW